MMQSPNLIPINLRPEISRNYSNYKLFLYCEGEQCSQHENIDFRTPGAIPVLFVTGNADSHLQVRSIASVALAKSFKKHENRFLFFTISFNEELNAIYGKLNLIIFLIANNPMNIFDLICLIGPLLKLQTEYTRHCIEHILKLFKRMPEFERPKSVLMIGNSMGGVISRGVLTPFDENDKFPEKKLVHTIITQSTPHIRPVIPIDSALDEYYNKVNQYWLNKSSTLLENVILVSTYGGTRDILVRSGLANINKWNSKSPATIISVYTGSIPYVWRSIDHRCMSWCKEVCRIECFYLNIISDDFSELQIFFYSIFILLFLVIICLFPFSLFKLLKRK
jgi:glycosylphosphatidylinositol deacylase